MSVKLNHSYELGSYRLDPDSQLLLAGGQPVHLAKKPFQVLLYLVEHRERFVSTAELLENFWPGKDVYDDTVRKTVGTLRKVLNDTAGGPRFIETRWGYGYRYIGPCAEQPIEHAPLTPEPAPPAGADFSPAGAATAVEANAPAPQTRRALPARHKAWGLAQGQLRTLAVLAGVIMLAAGAVALVAHRRRTTALAGPTNEAQAPPRSVAVLPLKNLTNDAANDYLCAGITENLINALAKLDGLKVIARGSVYSPKATEADPREVGQALGVTALLQGGMYRDGERLRVEVRLTRTEDGRVLWAGAPYDRKLTDIFTLQDEITRNVISGLEYKLGPHEEQLLTAHHTASVEAYQAYLLGRYYWYQRTKEGLTRSLGYFQAALKHDPNYAQAYVGIADYYDMGVWFLNLPPRAATEQAQAAAQRAIQLDDSLAPAHMALARALRMEWDWTGGAHELERALVLDPGNAEAHHDYAYTLLALGQPDRAVAEIRQARELDPLAVVMNVDVGEVLLYTRRYQEAAAALRHALEMDPLRANAHWDLALTLQQLGANDEAFAEYLRTAQLDGAPPAATEALRAAYTAAGLQGYWQKALAQRSAQARHNYVPPYTLAWSYAQMGDHDRAFACLEQAFDEHSPIMTNLRYDPLLDPLRADPRFAQLVARVGF